MISKIAHIAAKTIAEIYQGMDELRATIKINKSVLVTKTQS